MRVVTFAAIAALLAGACFASEFHSPNVVNLKSKGFEDKVNNGGVWFVKFYAPWCGHCKRLAPDWGKLGGEFKSNSEINVAHVDCTLEKDICSKFEVRGYPTLKVLVDGKEFKSYRGARDLASLKTFLADTAKEALGETQS